VTVQAEQLIAEGKQKNEKKKRRNWNFQPISSGFGLECYLRKQQGAMGKRFPVGKKITGEL